MSGYYLPSKPRFEILDGLRGVAAFIVLAYHHFEIYGTGNPADAICNHGYLAVDFFKRRITRLHPLIILSTLAGARNHRGPSFGILPVI